MSEHDEQSALIQWADWNKNMYPKVDMLFAIPNGAKLPYRKNKSGRRFSPEAIRLKAEGMKSGIPDLFLPVPIGKYHGLFIELKFKNNTATDEQEGWLERLAAQGYCAAIAWGCDEAIKVIVDYYERRI